MADSIEDPGDPRVALYRGLRDADLRRSVEAEHGVFVAEGVRSVSTLLESPWPVISILLTPNRAASAGELVTIAEQRGASVFVARADVFDAVAGFRVHRGVLALAERVPSREPQQLLREADSIVVVEAVNDHENLGSIFRNAAALGADAVLMDPTCSDPLYRRSLRVSLGNVLRVPFARLDPWPAGLSKLKESGFVIIALDPRSPVALDSVRPAAKLAVMVGSEGDGLTAAARTYADHTVRIPMARGVDSLNVATALAIGLDRLLER